MASFRDLPIRRKMAVAMLGTTVASLLLACAAFLAYEWMTSRTSLTRNITVIADLLADDISGTLAVADDALADSMRENAEKMLRALNAEPTIVAACLYDGKGAVFARYARGPQDKVFPPQVPRDGARFEDGYAVAVRAVTLDDDRLGTIYLRSDLSGLAARLRSYLGISGAVLLGAFLLALALSTWLQGLISRPILALTATALRAAETRDYSGRAEKMSGDELGLLTDAFNQLLGDIQERTNALQGANESLRKQAAGITDAAAVLAHSASQIVTAMQQLAASATESATAVAQTTTTVEEVRQTSQMSSEHAKSVSNQAQNAVEVAQGGKHSVNQTIEGMREIRAQMSSIAESILSLSAQSQAIGEIISSVDDLAAQSKLLAVNAAIQAAKAGEEGRGFSVVAQEVRQLAEQSKQATTKVRAILNDIQKATSSAALATEQGGKVVEAGVRQSTAAGESIAALADNISGAAQAAAQIAATSRQQFVGMEQVATAMESVKSASTQTVESTRQVETAARQLRELGEKLKLLAGQLKL
jgi:methyl-accepting chemotaxis protein